MGIPIFAEAVRLSMHIQSMARCVKIVTVSTTEVLVLFDKDLESAVLKHSSELFNSSARGLVLAVVYLHHQLLNFWPVVFVEAVKHVCLCALHIDLQQVDMIYALFANYVRESSHRAFVSFALEEIAYQLVLDVDQASCLGHTFALLVTQERLDDFDLIGCIGVGAHARLGCI